MNARALASTFAMVRFWFGVRRKSPRCTFAISRRPVSCFARSVSRDATGLDAQRQVPAAVETLDPAEAVALLRELERPRRFEREALAARDLGDEPGEPAILDRVLEPRALAHGTVAEVALRREHGLGDRQQLRRA